MKHRQIHIAGSGKYLPREIIFSSDLDRKLGKENGWVENKSGINKRHFASPDETTSFMAASAARQALINANLKPSDLDCIIGACGVMEQSIPCTAALVQKQLGLEDSGIAAFDINSTCLSFLSALDSISYMTDAGRFKNVLIISSDIPSLGINWSDMESCTIFGDGAAAIIVSQAKPDKSTNIIASHMGTYSKGIGYCQVQAGGTRLHPSQFKGDLSKFALFEMNGKRVYKLAAEAVDKLLEKLFSNTGFALNDIDWVIPHQASKLAMYHLRKQLAIPEEKLIDIYATHGNQVAASLPTALHEVMSANAIKGGDKILLIGTGAGISVGGIIMEYNQ